MVMLAPTHDQKKIDSRISVNRKKQWEFAMILQIEIECNKYLYVVPSSWNKPKTFPFLIHAVLIDIFLFTTYSFRLDRRKSLYVTNYKYFETYQVLNSSAMIDNTPLDTRDK